MENDLSTQECMDFLRPFLSGFTENLGKRISKIIHHYVLHAIWQNKTQIKLWTNGLFGSKAKRRILEGMLKCCPGLEQLKFSV